MADPLLSLDAWIWGFSAAIALTCVLTHALSPRITPTEAKPGLLSFVCASHILPHIRGEAEPPMMLEDVPKSSGATEAHSVPSFTAEFERHWTPSSARPLGKALVSMSLRWWALSHVLLGIAKACEFFQPYFVSCIMSYMAASEGVGPATGYKLMAAEVLQTLLATTARSLSRSVVASRLAEPATGAMLLLITRKTLGLGPEALARTSAAQAQQAIADSEEIGRILADSPLGGLVMSAVGVVYAFVALHGLAGMAPLALCIVAVCVAFAGSLVCQGRAFASMAGMHSKSFERLGCLNQLLSNFKTVKLLDSVHLFLGPLDYFAHEMYKLTRLMGLWAGFAQNLVGFVNYVMVLLVFFFSVFVRGDEVVYETGFLSYMFTVMLVGNLQALLGGWQALQHLHFKAGQVEVLLRLPETESAPAEGPLEVRSADFGWPTSQGPGLPSGGEGADGERSADPTRSGAGVHRVLAGIDLRPEPGELVLVCGAVGSGKTSLLRSLLGHTQRLTGTASLPAGPVAFQPQEPFLLDATIRENVLLGIPEDECCEADLRRALAASQLAADFRDPKSTLHAGRDRTLAGKQGSQLSGGQRARTALARTVYAVLQGAPLAVLDDPVSQVDNEVMDAAWDAAVLGAMRGATRVVAVNSQVLGRVLLGADRLVLLREGRITYDGPPAAAAADSKLEEALGHRVQPSPVRMLADGGGTPTARAAVTGPDGGKPGGLAVREEGGAGTAAPAALQLADLVRDCSSLRGFVQGAPPADSAGGRAGGPPRLSPGEWAALRAALRSLEGERKAEGVACRSVGGAQALRSLVRRTYRWVLPGTASAILWSFSSYCTCWTVRQWELGQTHGLGNLGWFLLLAAQYVFFTACGIATFVLNSWGISALGLSLNRDIARTLRELGMPYFWRHSADAETLVRRVCSLELDRFLDLSKVPLQLLSCLVCMTPVLYSAPQLAPVLLLVAPLFPRILRVRRWVVRHLQPCEQALGARSRMRAQDLLDGAGTLRALRREARFDLAAQEAVYAGVQLRHWAEAAGRHTELLLLCVRAAFTVGALVAIMHQRQRGGEAWAAQVLYTNATMTSGWLAFLCADYLRCMELLENYCVLEDFLQTDCREPAGGEDPPEGWPSGGAISIEDVTFRYAPHAPAALAGVSAEVLAGEKVGVVGKTGSGKSTLACLLFRLGALRGDAPPGAGRVRLDGVDLAGLRLSTVRRAVGLVPQEPAWFDCSLRHQVSAEATDAEILVALERCGLDVRQITRAPTLPEALGAQLAPSDLSAGQRQLLMAARALVRRPRVLVLDESTAFLDRESADRLLEVISLQCKDSTVLSVAHRLRFVLASDRILVLAGGRVVAYDTPARLLEDRDGYFSTNLRLEQSEDSG